MALLSAAVWAADSSVVPAVPATQRALSGQILDVDGKPLAGRRVCVCTEELMIWDAADPYAVPDRSSHFTTTDAQGHFSLPGQAGNFNLMVFTDDGYIIAKGSHLPTQLVLTLTRWGKLEGNVVQGDKPAPGIRVQGTYDNGAITDDLGPYPRYSAVTDSRGHFDFGRVLAGDFSVSRLGPGQSFGLPVSIVAAPGKTTSVTVPILGRTVTGRLAFPKNLPATGWVAQLNLLTIPKKLPQVALPPDILRMSPAQPRRLVQCMGENRGRPGESRHQDAHS